eukprot:3742162-Amphidinium_carterae.1
MSETGEKAHDFAEHPAMGPKLGFKLGSQVLGVTQLLQGDSENEDVVAEKPQQFKIADDSPVSGEQFWQSRGPSELNERIHM